MRAETLVASVVAGALLTGGTGIATAKEMNLKTAMFIASQRSIVRVAFDDWIKKVNAEGKGLVQVPQVVSREAVPSRQMPNALKSGVLEMAAVPPSYFSPLVPGASGFSAPQVGLAEQRKNGAYELINKAMAAQANAYLLAQYGHGVKFHVFSNIPLRTLDDFKGVKLRTSNTYKAFFDALGANPIQMSRSEIYTAMERGVVQGYANLNSEVDALGWDEVTKYRIDPGFYDTVVWVAINLDKWKSMTKEHQDFLKKMAGVLETTLSEDLAAKDVAIGDKMVAEGTIEAIALPSDQAGKYIATAYDSIWDTIEHRAPELGGKLRKLLTR